MEHTSLYCTRLNFQAHCYPCIHYFHWSPMVVLIDIRKNMFHSIMCIHNYPIYVFYAKIKNIYYRIYPHLIQMHHSYPGFARYIRGGFFALRVFSRFQFDQTHIVR